MDRIHRLPVPLFLTCCGIALSVSFSLAIHLANTALPTAAHDAQTQFWSADGTATLTEVRK